MWCLERAELPKANRTNVTEGLSAAWGGWRPEPESPHWAQIVFNTSTTIWWIYPDFTADILPHSQSGLPLTPINSLWAGYSKVSQMFGISGAGSVWGYTTDIWCWKVSICASEGQVLYLLMTYSGLWWVDPVSTSGEVTAMLNWTSWVCAIKLTIWTIYHSDTKAQ